MTKSIVYWAKPGSDKEHALVKASEEIGIDKKKAADVITLILSNYKKALNNPTVPEIHITDEFKLIPSKTKLLWKMTRAGIAYKLGVISKEYYNYLTYIPRLIWRRILDFRYIYSLKKRNEEALFWKNKMENIINNNSKALYEAHLAQKDVFISAVPRDHIQLMRDAKLDYLYKKAVRRRLFRKWKIDSYINSKKS